LRITQVAVVLVVLNIVTGAAVRLSDSGLGCPDWPTCARRHITPPLSLHPVVEFGNRMVVVALCVFTVAALLAALRRSPRRRELVWLSAGLVGGVVAEAVLGAVVVYSKLNPYVVMCHFLLGLAVLTDAVALALRAGRGPAGGAPVRVVARRPLIVSRVMLALLALAVAAGTATTGAGPHAGGVGAKRVPVPLADMARLHSGIVLVLVALTLALLVDLARDGAPAAVLDRARLLVGAMVLQGVIGYTQYFSHLPPLLVGVHVFGATVVWSAMVWFVDGLTRHRPEVPPAPDGAPDAPALAVTGPGSP
jgi:cytochrome c oxidase assembly protein subunit 15